MAGAVIPDDWDETTYVCQKVRWPASEQWQALLFGQITEAERTSFWDAETGSVDDAIAAVKEAENLTLPGYWTEPCDEVELVSAFWAYPTVPQAIAPSTWTTLDLDTLKYSVSAPEFDLPSNSHIPTVDDVKGLWHYDVSVTFTDPVNHYLRVMKMPGSIVLATSENNDHLVNLSFDVLHLAPTKEISIEVWSPNAEYLLFGFSKTWFNGHRVGPLE